MAELRIAAVQLDYQPVTRNIGAGWRLDEPLSPLNPLAEPDQPKSLLSNLRNEHPYCRDVCEKLMQESRLTYTNNLTEKLREILTFCFRNAVDIVVFPEYSIPVDSLAALRSFSNRMAIVAGIGYLQRQDIETLKNLGIETQGTAKANNAVVIMSPSKNFLVAKKNPSETEYIQSGSGPVSEKLDLRKGSFTIGVAICLDFIRERGIINQQNPDMVIIPALSQNIEEFTDETPRDFIRIFANHAHFGGTYVGAPLIKGLNFANRRGTTPLEKGVEGIVIVDWDYEHPWPVKPTSTKSLDHRLYARSAIVYKGRDREIAQVISRMEDIPDQDIREEDILQFAREIHGMIEKTGSRYDLLREASEAITEKSMILTLEEQTVLSRHLVLSSDILALPEWKYRRHIAVVEQLKRIQEDIPDVVAVPIGEYWSEAREIASNVRSNLVEVRHKGAFGKGEEDPHQTQLVFYATLGAYTIEDAKGSLPHQLTLLRTIADLQDPRITLRYRLKCRPDPLGSMQATFEIICTVRNYTREEVESLREGLGQLIHVTFTGAYSMQYTTTKFEYEESIINFRESANWWVEIAREANNEVKFTSLPRVIDWTLVVDLLRSLSFPAFIELQCSSLPATTNLRSSESETKDTLSIDFIEEKETLEIRNFEGILAQQQDDLRRLSIRLFVGSDTQLPLAVVNAIGIEFTGLDIFEILEKSKSLELDSYGARERIIGLSPVEAIRLFHPPYGEMYQTAGQRRPNLNIMVNEPSFPPTGILLGKAKVRQVRSDEEIDVRLTEADRLRHVYIIGRTGTGKTNLLKKMASQDVQIPGRGVTIIDPHGDLVDHVLREIPEERVSEVTFIDLSRTDALPILNPLDLDRSDYKTRDRAIQELILLMHSRVFHQYTGPRFDELVRLAFLTMLDEGYPEPASIVEVPRLFTDENYQRAAINLLKNEEIKKRWNFQSTVTKSPDYGELIHWVTSKFDDIAQDSILRCVLGGSKSTMNIEEIVRQAGILLVRIPEAVIGKQAADFIGSLMLMQLRMAIIRRREFGKLQHYHFIYVDEFQNFANTDFHAIVAEARKFNIGFTLANQNLEQLREFRSYTGVHEQRLINAIFGNVANLIVFGVGAFDAHFLSDHFSLRSSDILRIGRYEALAKILVNGYDSSPFTMRISEAIRLESPRILETIEKRMKEVCWVEPEKVFKEIAERPKRIIEESNKAQQLKRQTDWLEKIAPVDLSQEERTKAPSESPKNNDGANEQIVKDKSTEQQVKARKRTVQSPPDRLTPKIYEPAKILQEPNIDVSNKSQEINDGADEQIVKDKKTKKQINTRRRQPTNGS